jgi:hypothetical protein
VSAVLLLCAASALVMTGVIWFVQVVHYPLFDGVPPAAWPAYHARHTRRTGHVVIGPMVVELATAVALVADRPAGVPASLTIAGLACAVAAWALTLGVASPDHGHLGRGWDARVARRLVVLGWGRTAAWTGHAAVALAMLAAAG